MVFEAAGDPALPSDTWWALVSDEHPQMRKKGQKQHIKLNAASQEIKGLLVAFPVYDAWM